MPCTAVHEARLTADIVERAKTYGRYGCRRIRDEVVDSEMFFSLKEAQILI